ncbi:hypothetical protein FQN53_004675 [Emmonsiellopsis sp. PD_33]|nr:hypothetical protein FQN53_004675 [Emmonsiellopsis sp. PD_33]
MMLTDLPNELILETVSFFDSEVDINAFARACKKLYSVLNPSLYRYNVQHHESSALQWAAKLARRATVEHMLHARADLHAGAQTDQDYTLAALRAPKSTIPIDYPIFHYLIKEQGVTAEPDEQEAADRAAIIRLLVKNGADINARGLMLKSALLVSASRANYAVFWPLIENGADINTVDYDGTTVLHAAAAGGCCDAVLQYLITTGGLDVNVRDKEEKTPLHYAAEKAQTSALRFLIKNGGDANAADIYGKLPSHTMGMDLATPRPDASALPAFRVLFTDGGVDINAGNRRGTTVLHLAAKHAWPIALSEAFVIEFGADVNAKNARGKTAADYANEKNARHLLRLLRDHGAGTSHGNHDVEENLEHVFGDGGM